MPTDMIMGAAGYAGIFKANTGLEGRLYFSQYTSLESQINAIQPLEPGDTQETLHTPWGTWRHYRDALHSIDERFDAEHLVRRSHPAEDILHEAHYVPTIGEYIPKEESYEMVMEYSNPAELEVYNSKISLNYFAETGFEEGMQEESAVISINTETEGMPIVSEGRNIGEEPEEANSSDNSSGKAEKNMAKKRDLDLESKKELTKIFEEHIKSSAKTAGV